MATIEKKNKNETIKKAIMRSGIPFVIMMLIALVLYLTDGTKNEYMGTFYSGLIITIVAGATVIYEMDQYSLLKKSIIHFIIMLLTVYPILIISGWYSTNNFIDYLIIFIVFMGFGVVGWITGFLINFIISKKK